MKIAVTGHSRGIGKHIFDYFQSRHNVVGFSKSTGHDISKLSGRSEIIKQSVDADIFVNNAYNNYDDSQLELLKSMVSQWDNTNKMIINVSSRYTQDNNAYCQSKIDLDKFCEDYIHNSLYIMNLKPGLTDTDRVSNIQSSNKMSTNDVTNVIDFAINNRNNFRIHNITFGKSC
jgi:hypothetical protein